MSPSVPSAARCMRTSRPLSTASGSPGRSSNASPGAIRAARSAATAAAGSACSAPAPADRSACSEEFAVCRLKSESAMPAESMRKPPSNCCTSTPHRSAKRIRRISRAISAPRLRIESISKSSPDRAMHSGSKPAAGVWPSVPYSTRLSASTMLPISTLHGCDAAAAADSGPAARSAASCPGLPAVACAGTGCEASAAAGAVR